METDTTTFACQSVISTKPAVGLVKGGPKLVASEEEGGASGEEGGASVEEGGASVEEGGTSGEDETDPKVNKPISEHCLLEEYDTNFLFTMDVEGLLIENQHKRKSRKRKKSQGISDRSSPVLAPGGGGVKFVSALYIATALSHIYLSSLTHSSHTPHTLLTHPSHTHITLTPLTPSSSHRCTG